MSILKHQIKNCFSCIVHKNLNGSNRLGTMKITVQIICIGTDKSQQTVQTKIRLLLKKQSDQGLRCLPFHQHLLDALMQCYEGVSKSFEPQAFSPFR